MSILLVSSKESANLKNAVVLISPELYPGLTPADTVNVLFPFSLVMTDGAGSNESSPSSVIGTCYLVELRQGYW